MAHSTNRHGIRCRSLALLILIVLASAVPLRAQENGKTTEAGVVWQGDGIVPEQMLESILKAVPTGVGVVENRVFVSVNDYILNLTGYTREELIGRNARMLYPTQEESDYVGREKYRQIARKGTGTVESRWLRKDGDIRHVIISSTPLDPEDLSKGVTFTVLDITDRKIAEEALRESEERFSRAFLSSPVPLAISEIETGRFIDVNDRTVEILGYSKEEQIGRTSKEVGIWSDPGDRGRVISRLEKSNWFRNEPITFITKSGAEIFVLWSGQIMSLGGKEVLLSTFIDETDRVRSEAALAARTRAFHIAMTIVIALMLAVLVRLFVSLGQRKKAVSALRHSEEKYRSLFENAPFGMCLIGRDGRFSYVNTKFKELFGYGPEDVPDGKTWFEKAYPDIKYRQQAIEYWKEDTKDAKPGERMPRVFTVTCMDNSRKVVNIIPSLLSSGEFLVTFEDITERKQAEENLKRIEWMLSKKPAPNSKDRLRPPEQGYGDLTELNRDGVILNAVGREFLGNIAQDYLELLGTSSAIYEASGHYAFGIFTSGWCRMLDRASRDLCDTADNVEALNSGKWLCHESCWTHCSKEAINSGSPVDIECNGGIRLYAVPIIANGETVGVINFGYGDPPKSPEKLRQLADAYNLGHDDLEREANAYESRPYYIVEMAKNRLHSSSRLIGSMVEAKRAEEEREKLEAQLHLSQKMEAIGTLAGGIAHNLNNILLGVQGRASLMMIDKAPSHPDYEHLKGIEEYVRNAVELTKDLLGFARGGKYEVKPTDLNELIKNENRMFGQTKKEIRIEENYEKDLWTVEVDPGQMRQVLLNLYINAWQAMPGGGDLYVQTVNVVLGEEYIKPLGIAPGRYVKVSVTDTGVGMDSVTREKIFDPFFSTKDGRQGSGLGLASVYGIIKNHGGFINVYSEKGRGSTFNLYLPASEKEAVREETGAYGMEIQQGSGTILLVDDEDMILEVGRMMLERLGYRVLVAGGGQEAVDIYEIRKEEIELVILDMIMPGMGGGETYDRLKKINEGVRVLLSSGYAVNGQAKEILDRGCMGFLQKPFAMEELSRKVKKAIDRQV